MNAKILLALLAGCWLSFSSFSAQADTVVFSLEPIDSPASNTVAGTAHFLKQTTLNAAFHSLNGGLFSRKYWTAALAQLNTMLETSALTPDELRAHTSKDSLPHDRRSEVMMNILVTAHAMLHAEYASADRSKQSAATLVQAMRDGVSAALQAQMTLASSKTTP